MPARITLIRHGESMANVAHRWQGQSDAPLSENGQRQVQALGRRIARLTSKPDVVIASDLGRAATTAAALGLALESDPSWREANVGGWEGLTREEVATRFGPELEALARGEDVAMGGGESMSVFDARIDRAFDALVARLEGHKHAFVVTHGGVIWSLVARALGFRRKRRPVGRLGNTSLTTIEIDGPRATIAVYNDSMHLGAEAGWRGARDHEEEGPLALVSSAAGGDEPLDDVAKTVHDAILRGARELVLTPDAVRRTVASLVSLDTPHEALGAPAEGAITHLLGGKKRVVLTDYNVRHEDAP